MDGDDVAPVMSVLKMSKLWRLLCEQILPSASSATAARGRQSQD